MPEETVKAGGFVKLTAPNEITVHTEKGTKCWDVINNIACQVEVQVRTFTITTTRALPAVNQF